MNINKFTEKAQEAVVGAQNLATELTHSEITPEHLLVVLLEQEGGIVPSVLRKMNLDPANVLQQVQRELDKLPKTQGGSQPNLSSRLRTVTNVAEEEAQR